LWAPSEQEYFTPQRTLHLLSGTCGGVFSMSRGNFQPNIVEKSGQKALKIMLHELKVKKGY
jgi:hypothetical protein